ncbi:MAG: DUF1036 domain-containing protein [Succinivibrio sp.]
MNKLLNSVLLGCALSSAANALEITVDNVTDSTVVMAFSYLDSQSNEWTVDGWYNVNPNSKAKVNLNSTNDIYYLYSEFSNGKKLEGGKGSVKLRVADRSFLYRQNTPPASANREVSFLRARGNAGKAVIKIK